MAVKKSVMAKKSRDCRKARSMLGSDRQIRVPLEESATSTGRPYKKRGNLRLDLIHGPPDTERSLR